MLKAVISGTMVENVIEAPADFAPPNMTLIDNPPPGVAPGWGYENGQFFDPTPEPSPEAVQAARRAQVQAECARRLAAGFDYDFGDPRGVHRIGTTRRDMDGWDEVTKFATALINASDTTTTTITIATDTGACQVTSMEWNAILIAAAAFRQPIWLASFALQAMDPIPADYASDSYWP